MSIDPDKLTLEKMKINDRLTSIENYIIEGKELRHSINEILSEVSVRLKNVELMVHGDASKSDKYSRDGINRRLEEVENLQMTTLKGAKEVKENFLKVAIGSLVISIGASVLWLLRLVFNNLGRH